MPEKSDFFSLLFQQDLKQLWPWQIWPWAGWLIKLDHFSIFLIKIPFVNNLIFYWDFILKIKTLNKNWLPNQRIFNCEFLTYFNMFFDLTINYRPPINNILRILSNINLGYPNFSINQIPTRRVSIKICPWRRWIRLLLYVVFSQSLVNIW